MSPISTAKWTLILGSAFIFLYFGIEKFTNTILWIGWMPDWMNGLLGYDTEVWLKIIGVTELVLGVMVVIPMRMVQKTAAILMSLHLVGILTQVGWNDTAVRDMGLLCMTVAMWYLI